MKIKITSILSKYFFIPLIFVLFTSSGLFAQFIDAPTFDGTSEICAFTPTIIAPNAQTFVFKFKFNGFGAGATFSLEMSDANGSFANPSIRDTQFFSISPQSLTLTVPSNFIGGNGFKFRVRSGSVVSSVQMDPDNLLIERQFKIYFKLTDLPPSINNGNATATICGNFGITLSIDNPAILAFTSLKYKWIKNSDIIPNQTGPSLLVTTSGVYQVKYDYGLSPICSSVSSQLVTVNFNTNSGTYIITSSNGSIVETGAPTILSTPSVAGNTYKWYKDGVIIPLQTTNSLTTDQVGTYYLEVSDVTCISQTNKITLKNSPVQAIGTIIPNIVSPNNDGANDFWIIPADYIIGTGTNVQILDAQGKIALNSDNYLNDWPQTTIDFGGVNPVYYYIITPSNGIIKKGSITIIK